MKLKLFVKTCAGSSMKHRAVRHYGYEFLYGVNDVDPTRPLPGGLPPLLTPVLAKAVAEGLVAHTPDQLTINRYLPGQGQLLC